MSTCIINQKKEKQQIKKKTVNLTAPDNIIEILG